MVGLSIIEVKFDDVLKIYEKEICKNTKNKYKIYKFEKYKMMNIKKVCNDLVDLNYNGGVYNIFLIKYPKERIIMSLNIKDKLINHYVTRYYLMPKLECKLDDRNTATRKGKGRDYALKLVKKYLEKMKKYDKFYILKLDISKYFYSIDHNVLKSMLKEDLDDTFEYKYICNIIDSTNRDYINKSISKINSKNNLSLPYYLYDKGLPIGNMTSQFLSIYYLNRLDHKIIHDYKIKYFVKYMDDFILIHQDKEYLKEIKEKIEQELNDVYKLKLNKNKTNITTSKEGFIFLGYRFRVINNKTIINISNSTLKRVKKRIKEVRYLYTNNKLSFCSTFSSINNYYYIFKTLSVKRLVDKYFFTN